MFFKMLHLILIVTLIAFSSIAGGSVVKGGKNGWTHHVDLTEQSGIDILWRNPKSRNAESGEDENWLEMKITGKTEGYVGVGFSPNGAMTGSDLVIGWVDDQGKANLMVRST
jgi:hypothetical protein